MSPTSGSPYVQQRQQQQQQQQQEQKLGFKLHPTRVRRLDIKQKWHPNPEILAPFCALHELIPCPCRGNLNTCCKVPAIFESAATNRPAESKQTKKKTHFHKKNLLE